MNLPAIRMLIEWFLFITDILSGSNKAMHFFLDTVLKKALLYMTIYLYEDVPLEYEQSPGCGYRNGVVYYIDTAKLKKNSEFYFVRHHFIRLEKNRSTKIL